MLIAVIPDMNAIGRRRNDDDDDDDDDCGHRGTFAGVPLHIRGGGGRATVIAVAYGYDTLIARSARQGHWVLISTFRVLGTNRRIPIARRVPRRIAWPIARRSTRRVAWKEKRRRSCEEVLNALATFHRLRYAYERRRTHLTARTFAQWSVSRVLATCPVAMCSLALLMARL